MRSGENIGDVSVPTSNSYSSETRFSDDDQIRVGAQTLRDVSDLDNSVIDLAEQALLEGDYGTWNRTDQVDRVMEVAEQYLGRGAQLYKNL